MSTKRDHGDYVFQCGCRATLRTDTSNFEAARNLLRREGWKPLRKRGDDWDHHCDGCVRASAMNGAR